MIMKDNSSPGGICFLSLKMSIRQKLLQWSELQHCCYYCFGLVWCFWFFRDHYFSLSVRVIFHVFWVSEMSKLRINVTRICGTFRVLLSSLKFCHVRANVMPITEPFHTTTSVALLNVWTSLHYWSWESRAAWCRQTDATSRRGICA